MVAPSLPRRNDLLDFKLLNTGLSPEQYNSLFNAAIKEYHISYSGDFKHLDFLIQQLSTCRDKRITLVLGNVDVDHSVILPLSLLGSNVEFIFHNSPEYQSNFYNYLINLEYLDLDNIPISEYNKKLLYGERIIQAKFLKEFKDKLLRNRKNINDYSKSELMDCIFEYVCSNFPYDSSITRADGSGSSRTSQLGGTALVTYARGKGICEGRSKLIKLLANNKTLQVPCYIVSGYYKTSSSKLRSELPHMWNEFIDEHGNVIEYDSSFHLVCDVRRLPSRYEIDAHEPEVRRVLK